MLRQGVMSMNEGPKRGREGNTGRFESGYTITNPIQRGLLALRPDGFTDVDPIYDSAQLNGAWPDHPYPKSGNIIGSLNEKDLFVLKQDGLSDGMPNEVRVRRLCTGVIESRPGIPPNCG